MTRSMHHPLRGDERPVAPRGRRNSALEGNAPSGTKTVGRAAPREDVCADRAPDAEAQADEALAVAGDAGRSMPGLPEALFRALVPAAGTAARDGRWLALPDPVWCSMTETVGLMTGALRLGTNGRIAQARRPAPDRVSSSAFVPWENT